MFRGGLSGVQAGDAQCRDSGLDLDGLVAAAAFGSFAGFAGGVAEEEHLGRVGKTQVSGCVHDLDGADLSAAWVLIHTPTTGRQHSGYRPTTRVLRAPYMRNQRTFRPIQPPRLYAPSLPQSNTNTANAPIRARSYNQPTSYPNRATGSADPATRDLVLLLPALCEVSDFGVVCPAGGVDGDGAQNVGCGVVA